MGLGKTIMMLALIELHPPSPHSHPSEEEFIQNEYTFEEMPKSNGTLIIAPAAILYQWVSEVERHTPHLSLYVFTYNDKIQPWNLAKFDIVLTTYEDIRKEIYAAQPPPERSRRIEQRYERRKCALTNVIWWRVVVDEAQMVESPKANSTIVARMIPRIHCWAMTGTPVGKHGLDDLKELLVFLDAGFLTENAVWNRLQLGGSDVLEVFKRIMHRNTKENIEAELKLPGQVDTRITIPMSRIERHYYDELFKNCQEEIQILDAKLEQKGLPMDTQTKLMSKLNFSLKTWLLQLRQTW